MTRSRLWTLALALILAAGVAWLGWQLRPWRHSPPRARLVQGAAPAAGHPLAVPAAGWAPREPAAPTGAPRAA